MSAGSVQVESLPEGSAVPDAIYFLGDLITLGWRDENLGGWPARLLRRLGSDGFDLTGYNLGIRGDTSSEIAARWEDEVRRRRRTGDALLVFAFGVNDAKLDPGGGRQIPLGQTARNLQHILERAGRYRILLVGPAPIDEALMHRQLNAMGHAAMPTSASIAETTRCMAEVALGAGVPFLDLLAPLDASGPWRQSLQRTDGLHPSSPGHDLIAAQI